MELFYIVTFFILGTLFGSFLTVIGFRLPKGEDFITERSHCDNCSHTLSILDMVPIISYLFLRGKCRYCGKKISNLSTYMEFFCGVLFALSYYVFGFSFSLMIALGIVAMLCIISVSDVTYYIIPDEVLVFFSIYFILFRLLRDGISGMVFGILSGCCLFFTMYAIMLIGNFIFKKESLGGGDIKMMFVFGLVCNPFIGFVILFFASCLALPISLLILCKKNTNMVPFGPFLLISFMFVFFTKIDINMILKILRFY